MQKYVVEVALTEITVMVNVHVVKELGCQTVVVPVLQHKLGHKIISAHVPCEQKQDAKLRWKYIV